MSESGLDVVVVGSGPNGLSAAIACARAGASVLVIEASPTIGGGMRTAELTLPGFRHDVCSAVHPFGILSPYWRTLPLAEHGLRWVQGAASVAHPLDDGPAVLLRRSVEETSRELGEDAQAWRRFVAPFAKRPHALLADLLGPLRLPRHPFRMLRFGLSAMRSVNGLARARFSGARARALYAGCAAHGILPFDIAFGAGIGILFSSIAHIEQWPVAAGGSQAIADALASYLRELGGRIETGRRVARLADLPPARAYLLDTDPRQLATIAGDALPARYLRRLGRYRYGPGVFKVDWALDGPIPWADPRCLEASTVHLGGTLEEIGAGERAAWDGEHVERPFVLLCQQSQLDPSRAPPGRHTGYAYCHVPAGSPRDVSDLVEAQVERFAPGFRDRILARKTWGPADLERYNANYVGGAITGGAADFGQLFARPVSWWSPYRTPHRQIFLCSASTPPGGGVHGMCGYFAAQSALERLHRLPIAVPGD